MKRQPIKPIKPDPQDYEAIEREHGPLPANASDAEVADRYRDAQAAKLTRLYEQGKLPLETMREMDKIRSRRTKR
jgi:hypothetical protein